MSFSGIIASGAFGNEVALSKTFAWFQRGFSAIISHGFSAHWAYQNMQTKKEKMRSIWNSLFTICVCMYVCICKYICMCLCACVYVMVGHKCHGVHVRPEDSLQVSVISSRDPVQVVRLALLPISLVVVDFLFCFVFPVLRFKPRPCVPPVSCIPISRATSYRRLRKY